MATKDIRKRIKQIIAWFLCMGLFLSVYVPFYFFSRSMIALLLAKLRFSQLTGIGYRKNSTLALVSRKHKIHDVKYVSTDDELDFVQHRSTMYVRKMAITIPREITKAAMGLQEIRIISDQQLAYAILNTAFAHSVVFDERRNMYKLDLSQLQNFCLFEGFYYDAVFVRLTPNGRRISIEMADGREYRSDDPRQKYNYQFAKLHVQVCMSIYAPAVSHNYVHFVFPSAIAHATNMVLDKSGNMYNLLKPHVRFTERINHQALRVSNSLDNKRNFMNRYFYLWQAFPVTKEQIVEGIAGTCKNHYVGMGKRDCSSEYLKNEKTHSMGLQSRKLIKEVVPPPEGNVRVHELFPPRYVVDEDMQKIPYFSFLKQYYEVIHWFVKEIEPFTNKEEWELFKVYVSKYVPRFEEVDFVEAISTFIMQGGVLHHCDHQSYANYFMDSYACTTIRMPFVPFEDREEWKELTKNEKFTINEVMKNPLVVIHQRDIMRSRCLGGIFATYIPNPIVDLTLPKTKYEFQNSQVRRIAKDFHSKLRTLDGNLKTQTPPIDLPRERGDERAVGLQIIPLDNIINSICY